MAPSGFGENLVWTTTCVHGGTVRLYEDEWYGHVLQRHPEMKGQEELVRLAVEQPEHMRNGEYPDSRAFEIPSSTNPEGIRVFVRYEREMFVNGGVDGFVTTPYPIDSSKFDSKVGSIVYTKPSKGESKK